MSCENCLSGKTDKQHLKPISGSVGSKYTHTEREREAFIAACYGKCRFK